MQAPGEIHQGFAFPQDLTITKGVPMGTILLVVLVLVLIGVLPTWNHSRNWGYAPVSLTGILVLVLIFMLVTGRL